MATLSNTGPGLKRHLKPPPLPAIILMTDDQRLAEPEVAVRRLAPGSAVIVRHRRADARRHLARRLIALGRRHRIRVLIAGDARLAVALGADGVHLSEAEARRGPGLWHLWRRPDWFITASAHSLAAIHRADQAGVHATLVAPVFATKSHPGAVPIGPLRFQRWLRASPLPAYALGGIDGSAAGRLRTSGAVGFAGIGGIAALSRRLLCRNRTPR